MVRESLAFLEPAAYSEARKSHETKLDDARRERMLLMSLAGDFGHGDPKEEKRVEEDPFWDTDRLTRGFRALAALGFLSHQEQRRAFELAQGDLVAAPTGPIGVVCSESWLRRRFRAVLTRPLLTSVHCHVSRRPRANGRSCLTGCRAPNRPASSANATVGACPHCRASKQRRFVIVVFRAVR